MGTRAKQPWRARATLALSAASILSMGLAPTLAPADAAVLPPQADPATVVTVGRPTFIALSGRDPSGGPVTFSLSGPAPRHGTLTGGPPWVTYTPASGFLGQDSFGFTVTAADGTTSSALVSITVKRPNIVVVMSDDQTAEQQRFLASTNAILGVGGTTFSDMVVSYSECCPSRSTFLTGQYAHNHGVVSSALPTGGVTVFRDTDTLATRLQAAGYHTALAGKYLNGYGYDMPGTYVPPGWSDWLGLVEPQGYNFYDYDLSDNGRIVHRGRAAEDYSTDVLFARADQQIRDHAGTARPFFVAVTPTGPHAMHQWVAATPAPRHEGAAIGEIAPRTASFNQTDVSAMPSWIRERPLLNDLQIVGIDNIYRLGAESLLSIDEGVARLFWTLWETGELDNTLFVYTSDNGYHYGHHRIPIGKSTQYDEALRVPLLIRGPGFPAGHVATQPVANIDLAPTLAAAAGVDLGRVADGVPLTRFANDPAYGTKRPVVIENGPLWGRRTFVGVRDDRWTYIRSSNGEQELYDRWNDPHETTNLVGVPWAALAHLSGASRTNQLATCAGAACHPGL